MLKSLAAILAVLGITDIKSQDLPRTALWRVEQACMADFHLTGSPFPCLEVHLESKPAKGYVVFETPDDTRDIVLMPAVRVTGLEDPFLSRPGAADYFALAWAARHHVNAKTGRALPHDAVGLAVNSSLVRSQDQFHIHIDCLAPGVRRTIATIAARLPSGEWSAKPHRIAGHAWYARVLGPKGLAEADVMAALHQSPPAREGHFATLAAAVVGTLQPSGSKGFVLLTADTRKSEASPETLLDHSCRTTGGLRSAD